MSEYERVKIEYTLDEYTLELFEQPRTFTDIFYWPVYRFFRWYFNPANVYRRIKWFIQRGRRGYADCDVWNLSYYTARVLRDSLRQLADKSHGWPGDTSPWPKFEDWTSALRKTADGLDHYVQIIDVKETCTCCGKYCNEMDCPIITETFLDLFALWPGLWD